MKPKDSSASRLVGAEVDVDAGADADVEMEVELGLAEWLAGAKAQVGAELLEETWRGWLSLAGDEDV